MTDDSAPESVDRSREYTFGPVEYSPDGGNTWLTLSGATKVNRVLGTGALDTEWL